MTTRNDNMPREEEPRQESEHEGAKTRADRQTGTSKYRIKHQRTAWKKKKKRRVKKGGSKN